MLAPLVSSLGAWLADHPLWSSVQGLPVHLVSASGSATSLWCKRKPLYPVGLKKFLFILSPGKFQETFTKVLCMRVGMWCRLWR